MNTEVTPAPILVAGSNGLATAALVCGIVGSAVGLIPLLFLPALTLGILGLTLGGMGRRRARGVGVGRRVATWAVVLGLVSVTLGCVGLVIVDKAVTDFRSEVERIGAEPGQ